MPTRWRTTRPGLRVGDVRVREHVEDLVEQPAPVYLGLGAVDEPLRKFVAGSGIRAGQRLVEQLHQLIEHLNVGFGQRRQQHRVTPIDRGALQRLIGRAAADLGEHASPPNREPGQVKPIGAVPSQEFQLVQLGLQQLGGGNGGPAAQPRQASQAEVGVDIEQAVQLHRPRWLQQRPEPVVGLGASRIARRGHPTRQAVDRGADNPFGAQPVTSQLQQDAGSIVFERPGQQELVEQLAFASGAQPPAQASQHPCPVFPSGSSLPAAILRQQYRRGSRRNTQSLREPIECDVRATGQVVGNPAQPRQRRQLNGDAETVLLAVEARQPGQIVGGQREVGDRVLDSDLVRPAAQPGKLGIRQVADRHLASEGPAVRAITAATLARPKRRGKATVAARKGILIRTHGGSDRRSAARRDSAWPNGS